MNGTRLQPNQVHEIVRLHREGVRLADIAERFGRRRVAIHRIVCGETYRDITCPEHVPTEQCVCLRCEYTRLQARNSAVAAGAKCDVFCLMCADRTVRRVVDVYHKRGLVLCDSCDGRRR